MLKLNLQLFASSSVSITVTGSGYSGSKTVDVGHTVTSVTDPAATSQYEYSASFSGTNITLNAGKKVSTASWSTTATVYYTYEDEPPAPPEPTTYTITMKDYAVVTNTLLGTRTTSVEENTTFDMSSHYSNHTGYVLNYYSPRSNFKVTSARTVGYYYALTSPINMTVMPTREVNNGQLTLNAIRYVLEDTQIYSVDNNGNGTYRADFNDFVIDGNAYKNGYWYIYVIKNGEVYNSATLTPGDYSLALVYANPQASGVACYGLGFIEENGDYYRCISKGGSTAEISGLNYSYKIYVEDPTPRLMLDKTTIDDVEYGGTALLAYSSDGTIKYYNKDGSFIQLAHISEPAAATGAKLYYNNVEVSSFTGTGTYQLRTVAATDYEVLTGSVNITPIMTSTIIRGPVSLRLEDGMRYMDVLGHYEIVNGSNTKIMQNASEKVLGDIAVAGSYSITSGNATFNITLLAPIQPTIIPLTINETERARIANNKSYCGTWVYKLVGSVWQPIESTTTSVDVDYTYDETIDQSNIEINGENLEKLTQGDIIMTVYDTGEPLENWGKPVWSSGKPMNHDVWVYSDGTYDHNVIGHIKTQNAHLLELIEILKNYQLENLTFSSSERVSVNDGVSITTYYQDTYNANSIIERILKNVKMDKTIKVEDTEWLKTQIVGVDDIIKDSSLEDAVFAIGRKIDRVPVLYINTNYANDGYYYLLAYEEKKDRNEVLEWNNVFGNLQEQKTNDIQDRGAGQIVCDASNMETDIVSYPSDTGGIYPRSETEATGTRNSSDITDWVIELPYPMTEVVKLVKITSGYINNEIEIPCVEYNDWVVDTNRQYKSYYKEGERLIHISNDNAGTGTIPAARPLFLNNENGIVETTYRVEYYPNINARVKIGKGHAAKYNQVSSIVDGTTLGNELESYKITNESEDIVVVKAVNNYNSILHPSVKINKAGVEYVITSTSFNSGRNNGYSKWQVAYQLNKNARRNMAVKSSERIREYQIYYDNVTDRYINIMDDVGINITINGDNTSVFSTKYINKKDYILGDLVEKDKLDVVSMWTHSLNYTSENKTTSEDINHYVASSLNKTIVGNSIIANFAMYDNVSAGKNIVIDNRYATYIGFTQSRTNYADNFGRVENGNFVINSGLGAAKYPRMSKEEYIAQLTGDAPIKVLNQYIDKDARETLNITYQLYYNGEHGTKLSKDFLKLSSLSGDVKAKAGLYVYKLSTQHRIGDILSANEAESIAALSYTSNTFNATWDETNSRYKVMLGGNMSYDTNHQYCLMETVGIGRYKVIAIFGGIANNETRDYFYIYVN